MVEDQGFISPLLRILLTAYPRCVVNLGTHAYEAIQNGFVLGEKEKKSAELRGSEGLRLARTGKEYLSA